MHPATPDEKIAADITAGLTGAQVTFVERLETGNQNYVYAVGSTVSEYVIRLTTRQRKNNFAAALYWQRRLLPLGVPLAEFIFHNLDDEGSPFPALLMKKLPGADVGKVYSTLTEDQKKNLAQQMAGIHQATRVLPEGAGFGYMAGYEAPPSHASWYDFLMKDMNVAAMRIKKAALFGKNVIMETESMAEKLKPVLLKVRPQIFMPDTTVKNVIVHDGKLMGIVDVDEMCSGDPLFVLSLTYAGLEIDGHDVNYADDWAHCLHLDAEAETRLEFYRLLHTVWFMGENSLISENSLQISFDVNKLHTMYHDTLNRLRKMQSHLGKNN